jgi:hypothetical protein
MNRTFTIEQHDEIVITRFSQPPTMEDICAAVDEVAASYPSTLRVWDMSAGVDNLDSDKLRRIAQHGKSKLPPHSKAAIIAPEDAVYGLSRMYEVYRENPHTINAAFRTEQEAIAWLQSEA